MSEEVKKVVIDDTEYAFDDLSEKAKYVLTHMQELKIKLNNLRRKIDKEQMAYDGFANILKSEIEDVPVEAEINE